MVLGRPDSPRSRGIGTTGHMGLPRVIGDNLQSSSGDSPKRLTASLFPPENPRFTLAYVLPFHPQTCFIWMINGLLVGAHPNGAKDKLS